MWREKSLGKTPFAGIYHRKWKILISIYLIFWPTINRETICEYLKKQGESYDFWVLEISFLIKFFLNFRKKTQGGGCRALRWSSRVVAAFCGRSFVVHTKRGMKLFIIKRNSSRKTNRRIIFCSPYTQSRKPQFHENPCDFSVRIKSY